MSSHSTNYLSGRPKYRKGWKKRPSFGFLLASLHTGASRALWPGLIDAAERLDINLICFPGGRLRAQVAYESQRNVIYDLAGEKCLDGIITWASSLGGVISPAEINSFHSRYQSLPIVSLAQFMEGTPTVSVDSYHGMRALLEHLIKNHGYQRLAFIRGPEGHYYAQERYRAYLDTLQAHNLHLNPELVTRPLRWEAGAEAVNILLDERGLRPGVDFQAVVAVSDMLALWALKTLQERGFQVPRDVAVTGFNNSIEERLATPPLTTVDLPFYDQGAKAVEILLAQWKGETVPALITLPSGLVVRQSCGCSSAAVAQAAHIPENAGQSQTMSAKEAWGEMLASRKECLIEMAAQAHVGEGKISEWIAPVCNAFLAEVEGASTGIFIRTLEDVLDHAMRENNDIFLWHGAISALRRWAFSGIPSEKRNWIESLFAQARIVVSEAIQRSHAYRQWQSERQAENLRETARILLTTFDIPQLTDALTECLPRLGIPSVYLALYENTSVSLGQARLILASTEQGQIPLGPDGRLFLASQLVPPDLLPSRRYSLVVEPLYFQEKPIGFVVFELGPHEGDVYELLRGNLSSALQGAFLFQEIQQARITAEKADRIKTRLLANVSHEMRTPLNIILGYTQNALKSPYPYQGELPPELVTDIRHIQSNAEHQLRVINDLLDLSRAQIDELDLSLELMNPLPVLAESFHSLADQSNSPDVTWHLELPERLPVIRADPVRLRQIFLNLLSNARKFTEHGRVVLGAEITPPQIHFWVTDTGLGIPADQKERIFEPFVTIENGRRISGGIGLGLSITRHLIALHGGTMTLDSEPGLGSTFHVYLPLPALGDDKMLSIPDAEPVLLLISSSDQPAKEILDMSQRQGLKIHMLRSNEDLEKAVAETRPVALAWDLAGARPGDWVLVRRLRHYPGLSRVPFVLFGQSEADKLGTSAAMTGFVLKSGDNQPLLAALDALYPLQAGGPILIVDDESQVRATHQSLVENALPTYPIRLAEDGASALKVMGEELPALVLLDLVMPGVGGADVLDQMRADPRLRQVPVIILSNKVMSLEDVKRLEKHYRVVFQSKGIWSEAETASALHRALFGTDVLPPQTSALVKRAVAYLHENYSRSLSRWEIAEAVGVSEDYLSRVFSRELGLTPWDYLNRYRILQSKALLLNTAENIGNIAHQVGFKDQSYFSRVFRKATGHSPQAFRDFSEER
jgi:signal transduction histidine kinase/DNA-binding LacI/PurR family transcriptional regulator/AraC-like DNA-binding protein